MIGRKNGQCLFSGAPTSAQRSFKSAGRRQYEPDQPDNHLKLEKYDPRRSDGNASSALLKTDRGMTDAVFTPLLVWRRPPLICSKSASTASHVVAARHR